MLTITVVLLLGATVLIIMALMGKPTLPAAVLLLVVLELLRVLPVK